MSLDGRHPSIEAEWVSTHEAAMLIGVSAATLRRWSDSGDIRTFTTPGGHRRFSRTAITGLMSSDRDGVAARDVLFEAHQRLLRLVASSGRRATAAEESRTFDEDDRSRLGALGREMLDGIFRSLAPDDGERDRSLVAARASAAACGALARRHGIGLRRAVLVCLGYRALIVGELADVAGRHDLEAGVTARWLETATRVLDDLLAEMMIGYECGPMVPDPLEAASGE
jgi:excisionase family DNA binding protein